MEKAVIIHCSYCEGGRDVEEIIQESLSLFLQKSFCCQRSEVLYSTGAAMNGR